MSVSFPGLGINNLEIQRSFEIFGMNIYWYGVIIALGLILAIIYGTLNSKRLGINPDKLLNCVIVGVITGIIGARSYYVLFNLDYYSSHLDKIIAINEGGLAIYGGIIGALIGGLIVAKISKMNIPALLDVASVGFLIGQGIGRWGNFFNQEAYGVATTLPWGMVSEGTNGVIVHPCFLYESIWCLLGVLLLHLFSHSKFRKYNGQMALLYLVWYGAERAIVEGLRTDSLLIPNTDNLRVSQLLSVLICAIGLTLLIILYVKKYERIIPYTEPVVEEKATAEVKDESIEEISSNSTEKKTEENKSKEKKKFVVNLNPKAMDLSADKKQNVADDSTTDNEDYFDINDIIGDNNDSDNTDETEIDDILNDIKKNKK